VTSHAKELQPGTPCVLLCPERTVPEAFLRAGRSCREDEKRLALLEQQAVEAGVGLQVWIPDRLAWGIPERTAVLEVESTGVE
jgi:hypothetical protein